MKVIKKVVAALMVLGALAALTVGVVLKPGQSGYPQPDGAGHAAVGHRDLCGAVLEAL